jgi:hypothetical protein
MWDWINCHLFGRHEHGIAYDQGSIHLRCLRCGHRSNGWQVDPRAFGLQPAPLRARRPLMRLVARRHG